MKHRTLAAFIAATFFLSGCGVGKPFVQPGVKASDSAHVVTESDHLNQVAGWDQRIYIIAVDGKETHPGIGLQPEEAYLSEGPHEIQLMYLYMGAKARGKLSLVAQQGHEYVVHRQQVGERMKFWITDGWSGPVVGGIVD